jgi:nitrate reductase delta subunit
VTLHLPTRALAALLHYPEEELRAALPEIEAALASDPDTRAAAPLARHLATGETLDRQEEYVGLFDRTRSVSLHLFEHVHGSGKERGPAMIELRELYLNAGLEPDVQELPDYLPMLLEFAAVAPEAGRKLLRDASPVLDLLHGRLLGRGSPYAAAVAACLALAGVRAERVAEAPEAETLEQLDAAWEEAAVTFGPGSDPAAECGTKAPNMDALRAARRPAPGVMPVVNPTPNRPAVLRRGIPAPAAE